jgi:heptose I phosphotransferase
VSRGSLWGRITRGIRWSWVNPRYRGSVPDNLDDSVMGLVATDRLHVKQGRSTGRVLFPETPGKPPLSVFLKRHYRLPWLLGLAATLRPAGRYSPAAAELAHLRQTRALGVAVPAVVAVGEQIGPWGRLRSYLMVAELTGCQELHLALPELARILDPAAFAAAKRRIVPELARITAALHNAQVFHKDLYLCHFFLDRELLARDSEAVRIVLIDLHRLRKHRLGAVRWRWKDLGQLLYSTAGVEGVEDRDLLRFWMHYRRRTRLRCPRIQAQLVRLKAGRYQAHNRAPGRKPVRPAQTPRPTGGLPGVS